MVKKILLFFGVSIVIVMLLITGVSSCFAENIPPNTNLVCDYQIIGGNAYTQLAFSTVLSDGCMLLSGMEGQSGYCLYVDKKGKVIQHYQISGDESAEQSVTVRGANKIGENIVMIAHDYTSDKSFVALAYPDGHIDITQWLQAQCETAFPLEDGLLVAGSFFTSSNNELGYVETPLDGDDWAIIEPKTLEVFANSAEGTLLALDDTEVVVQVTLTSETREFTDETMRFGITADTQMLTEVEVGQPVDVLYNEAHEALYLIKRMG